jgi:nitroreductase
MTATVAPLISARWSPRAFREDPIPPAAVTALFEAARAAPSCFNDQPWQFVYATAPAARARLLALLVEGNRTWAQRAPLVGVSFARKIFGLTGKPNRWGQHDAGMAAMNLALQAHSMGLAAHFMGGFDEAAAYAACGMDPEKWTAMAAFVVGAVAEADSLPEPLREREKVRSPRKAISEVARELA